MSFIASKHVTNILERVLPLTVEEAARVMSAEKAESIQDILEKYGVPKGTQAIRFNTETGKEVIVISEEDMGCQLAPEVHPGAYAF